MHIKQLLFLSALLLPTTALPRPWKLKRDTYGAQDPQEILDVEQNPRGIQYRPNKKRADAVREAFRHAWYGYQHYAFPNDELHPLGTNGVYYGNSRNGWGASAVDALSTAIVMGEKEIVNTIIAYIPTIQFSKTKDTVSLFETTIRYLGGLVSAYDFVGPEGPLKNLVNQTLSTRPLLDQAKTLADLLKFAFYTPTGVPHNDLVFPNAYIADPRNGLATTGTLILEWTRLSDLTGDPEYYRLADRAEQYLLRPYPPENEPYPGLIGAEIFVDNGTIATNHGSWSGGADSFYEYLIKMWVYDSRRFSLYRDRFVAAAESSMKYLAQEPRPGTVFLAAYSGKNLQPYSQHLTCFDGGTFILGGVKMGRQDMIDFGRKLVDGCYKTYHATATGIGPEQFSWDSNRVPRGQEEFFAKNGWWILNGAYILRPEVLESIYYAYRATGDTKYQEWAWEAFVNINRTCRTQIGFTEINDVNQPDGGQPARDNQESFFFAEVLKYAYLIHAEDADWQVQGPGKPQKWVYNTEAHPVKAVRW